MTNNLDGAKLIGDWYTKTGLEYDSDDNTYTEYTYMQKAMACDVALKSQLTCSLPLSVDDMMTEMFGS